MSDEAARTARKLHELCNEALEICGDDWRRIESHIKAQVARLPTNEQNAFFLGVSKIVGHQARSSEGATLH